MNTVTQEVASRSSESAAAAEELGGQAEGLREMVNNFELTNAQGSQPSPAAHPVRRNGTNGHAAAATQYGGGRRNGKSTVKLAVLDEL